MKKKCKKSLILTFFLLFTFSFIANIPINAAILYPILNAKANLLMDADSGVIYLADNIDEKLGIASLTKLMSIYVVFDEIKKQDIKMDDEVTISKKVYQIKQDAPAISGQFYQEGQIMTVEELIYESLIYSDNGAIIALSEYVSNSEENHVKKMNKKAQELGMDSTTFYNVSGLTMSDYGDYQLQGSKPTDYNVSTARNMGLLCYNLLRDYPKVLDITSITTIDYQGITYYNWNQLLPGMTYEYEGVKGLKTGTSNEAGECLIGYLETDERNYISIVLNAPSQESSITNRYLETITIYDWAEEQRYSNLFSSEDPLYEVKINGAGNKYISLYPNNIDVLTSDKVYLKLSNVEYNSKYFDENDYLKKDIPKGEVVATLTYKTPPNTVNLQTIFDENDSLKVEFVAQEDIVQENAFLKIFSAFDIFVKQVYDNI